MDVGSADAPMAAGMLGGALAGPAAAETAPRSPTDAQPGFAQRRSLSDTGRRRTDAEKEAEVEALQNLEELRTDQHIDAMAMTPAPGIGTSLFKGGVCGAVANSLRSLLHTLLDTVAHFIVFIMIAHGSWMSFIVVATASAFTTFYTFYDGGSMAAKLDWQFVSFALVFPVTFFLAETWRRRERGLSKMAGIKSLSLWIYLAHRDWLRQEKIPPDHLPQVKTVIVRMLCDLHGYVTLRRLTTRDLYFAVGQNKRFLEFEAKRRAWRREMYIQMKLLSRLCENLKDYGLPTNEASRINQYHSLFMRDVEEVMNIKDYRTPQGIRSFTRIYVILIWTLFGSYFAWVAQETSSFAFALCLTIMCSLALAGLIKVSMTMEDPFELNGVDDVRTSRDLAEVISAIRDDSLEDSLNELENLRGEGSLHNDSRATDPSDVAVKGSSLFPVLEAQSLERNKDAYPGLRSPPSNGASPSKTFARASPSLSTKSAPPQA